MRPLTIHMNKDKVDVIVNLDRVDFIQVDWEWCSIIFAFSNSKTNNIELKGLDASEFSALVESVGNLCGT